MVSVYSYQDMKRDLKRLSVEYQGLVRIFRLAETAGGRWLYGIVLGNVHAKNRIVIQASMHAREWLNTELIIRMVRRTCRQWKKSVNYKGIPYRRLLEGVCFFIIPMVNPDGVAISQRENWKSRNEGSMVIWPGGRSSRWKANARGVDLNRNFSTGFAGSTRTEKGSEEYAGRRPFSERETRGLVKLICTVRPKAVINYHSTGHLIYYRENSSLVQLAKKLTGYRLCREEGEANGNMGDWLSELGIAWCTLETCVGRAPVGRWQLLLEWRKHKELLAELCYCEWRAKSEQ